MCMWPWHKVVCMQLVHLNNRSRATRRCWSLLEWSWPWPHPLLRSEKQGMWVPTLLVLQCPIELNCRQHHGIVTLARATVISWPTPLGWRGAWSIPHDQQRARERHLFHTHLYPELNPRMIEKPSKGTSWKGASLSTLQSLQSSNCFGVDICHVYPDSSLALSAHFDVHFQTRTNVGMFFNINCNKVI